MCPPLCERGGGERKRLGKAGLPPRRGRRSQTIQRSQTIRTVQTCLRVLCKFAAHGILRVTPRMSRPDRATRSWFTNCPKGAIYSKRANGTFGTIESLGCTYTAGPHPGDAVPRPGHVTSRVTRAKRGLSMYRRVPTYISLPCPRRYCQRIHLPQTDA